MTVLTLKELVQLSPSEMSKLGAEVTKPMLSKLALEVNTVLQSGSPAGVELVKAAADFLGRIQGNDHPELRINCLVDAAHFYYVIGQTFNAIEPASRAVRLSTESQN